MLISTVLLHGINLYLKRVIRMEQTSTDEWAERLCGKDWEKSYDAYVLKEKKNTPPDKQNIEWYKRITIEWGMENCLDDTPYVYSPIEC